MEPDPHELASGPVNVVARMVDGTTRALEFARDGVGLDGVTYWKMLGEPLDPGSVRGVSADVIPAGVGLVFEFRGELEDQ